MKELINLLKKYKMLKQKIKDEKHVNEEKGCMQEYVDVFFRIKQILKEKRDELIEELIKILKNQKQQQQQQQQKEDMDFLLLISVLLKMFEENNKIYEKIFDDLILAQDEAVFDYWLQNYKKNSFKP